MDDMAVEYQKPHFEFISMPVSVWHHGSEVGHVHIVHTVYGWERPKMAQNDE